MIRLTLSSHSRVFSEDFNTFLGMVKLLADGKGDNRLGHENEPLCWSEWHAIPRHSLYPRVPEHSTLPIRSPEKTYEEKYPSATLTRICPEVGCDGLVSIANVHQRSVLACDRQLELRQKPFHAPLRKMSSSRQPIHVQTRLQFKTERLGRYGVHRALQGLPDNRALFPNTDEHPWCIDIRDTESKQTNMHNNDFVNASTGLIRGTTQVEQQHSKCIRSASTATQTTTYWLLTTSY